MLPCNTTILLGLDFNLLFRGTQASLTLLRVVKRYCKEMPDLEKNRDLNQVSWKQEHPHNLASRKNRAGHTSRPQGDRNTFRCRRVTWILHTDTEGVLGHPHPAWRVPVPPAVGFPGLSSPSLHHYPCPCFSLPAICSSPRENLMVKGSLLCYWPALPCHA